MKISFLIEGDEDLQSVIYQIRRVMLDPEFKRSLVVLDTENIQIPLREDTKKVKKLRRREEMKFNKNYS